MNASMYQRVMGGEFDKLAPAVQRFHRLAGTHELHGEVEIGAPAGVLPRLMALCMGMPRTATTGPIRFVLEAGAERETWTRHFPGRTMTSTLRYSDGHVVEELGPARLTFTLLQEQGALQMRLDRMTFLRIPCPRWLMPRVVARETDQQGRFHFHIEADVPFIGPVGRYNGFLKLD
jgi:hypothetical protein